MKVYSYCSYEGSPCGFILGSISFDTSKEYTNNDKLILQKDGVLPLIQTTFECGIVDFVFGNLPDSDTYWIEVKNLNAKDKKPYLYLNFAFETHRKEEYLTLLSGILHKYGNVQEFTRILANFITLQNDDPEFGLVINADAIQSFYRNCREYKSALPDFYTADERLYLFRKVLSDTSNKDRSKELSQALKLGKGYAVIHDSENHCHIVVRGFGLTHLLKNKVINQIKKTCDDIIKKDT